MAKRGTEETILDNIGATANGDASAAATLERHVFGVIITGTSTVTFRWATNADPTVYHTIDSVAASGTTHISAAYPILNVSAAITSGNVTVVHYAYEEG